MQLLTGAKRYCVAVIARNIVEIYDICAVYFAEMLSRKFKVYPCHCFSASDFFVAQTDIAAFVVSFKIEYIICA